MSTSTVNQFAVGIRPISFQPQIVHRAHIDPNMVEVATLLAVKTGGCPDDFGFSPKSVHSDTGLDMSGAVQALCFVAGAHPVFYGDKLLTTGNPYVDADSILLQRLGLKAGNPVPGP